MINKIWMRPQAAVADVADGSTIMVSGFGEAGLPVALLDALAERGSRNLTIVSNNAGTAGHGIGKLILKGQVRKVICSFPRQAGSTAFDELHRAGRIELELVPQGTLAERIRAGGAGIGGFYSPTGVGTAFAEGKETRTIDDVMHVLEFALRADYAFVKAQLADRWGNLTYHLTGRNFGPAMATAARCTIAEVARIVDVGFVDPELIVTPSIFVDRIVPCS